MRSTKTAIPTAVALTLACILTAGSNLTLASPEAKTEKPPVKAAPKAPGATSNTPGYLGPPVKGGAGGTTSAPAPPKKP